VLGVDALIMGSITALGRDDQHKGGASGTVIPMPIIGGIRVDKSKAKAAVGITFKLVNAETAQILLSGTAKGQSKRESNSFAETRRIWKLCPLTG
jgi:curli biogenesis system outer membrane secretion channel CsgG